MSKAEWVAKATDLGIENAESFTVAELQAKVAEAGAAKGSSNTGNIAASINSWDQNTGNQGPIDAQNSNNPPNENQPPVEESVKPGFKYPVYDLWKVNATVERDKKQEPTGNVKFEAVTKLREKVKLEKSAADELNRQSHNSNRRYYLSGSITNGNVETAAVK
jgi:hypothetical protein